VLYYITIHVNTSLARVTKMLKKDYIYNQLREAICTGKIGSNEKLPGELELARKYEVSRVTLRDALHRLEQDKLVIKIHGKGTFISQNTSGKRFLAICHDDTLISNPIQYILPGIEKQLSKTDIKLSSCSIQFFRSVDIQNIKSLIKEQGIEGIFLLTSNYNGDEPEIAILETIGLPVVMPHAYKTDRATTKFAIMNSDNRQAFGDGIRELAGQGHKRIGTIFSKTLLKKYNKCRGFTINEYMNFLELNNLDAYPELFKTSICSEQSIFEVVKELMFGPKPPTAIICYSDFYAIHVYAALKKLRIQIPEQVSVMGFCGYPGREFMSPALSTVDLMYENIGRIAADLMLKADQWHGKEAPLIFSPYRVKLTKSVKAPTMDYILA